MDKDRRVSIETISAQFDVSVGSVHTTIREELKMQKICTKFVPRVLILVTDCLSKMGIKTVPHPPYSPDLAPCNFWLFPKLKEKFRSCRYETIEMKEAVTKVIDALTQDDFHVFFWNGTTSALQLEEITSKGDWSFMCVLSIKVPIGKMSGNLSYAPHTYKHTNIYLSHWERG